MERRQTRSGHGHQQCWLYSELTHTTIAAGQSCEGHVGQRKTLYVEGNRVSDTGWELYIFLHTLK